MNTTEMPGSIDYWYSSVVTGTTATPHMAHADWQNVCSALRNEPPRLLSVIPSRWCELQCEHCVFQKESPTPMNDALPQIVATLSCDMQGGTLVHEGRVFRPEHGEILRAAHGMKLGLIDRGSYVRYIKDMPHLNHLDVSLDGPEPIHNRQRRNATAYKTAMTGLLRGTEVADRVSSLFTATTINFASLPATAPLLPPHVEWHVTPVSPARPEIAHLELSLREMSTLLSQLKTVNRSIRPVVLRIYELADLIKVASVIGKSNFTRMFMTASVARSTVIFNLDGLTIAFYPKSLLANETFVVDSDGSYLMPGAVAFSSTELKNRLSRSHEDLSDRVVCQIRECDRLASLYVRLMGLWQGRFSCFWNEISAIGKQLNIERRYL